MSQEQIVKFLEQNPDNWFTYRDIANKADVSLNSINVSLRKLRSWGLINYKEIKGRYRRYEYQAKCQDIIRRNSK